MFFDGRMWLRIAKKRADKSECEKIMNGTDEGWANKKKYLPRAEKSPTAYLEPICRAKT